MKKTRTMNEYRQVKDTEYTNPGAKTLSDQGGEYTVPSKGADPVPFNHIEFHHNDVDELVDKIADKLQSEIFDSIFQAVNDEMSKYYTFQDTNYLTEAGLELFEDEWFEFYHENHGKIMHKLLQNLK